VRIDVFFDTTCPWCFIGKRRLEKALRTRPLVTADIHWRPFLLNPDIPIGGLPRRKYLEDKFGSTHRVERVFGAIAKAGAKDGLNFDFNALTTTPNTLHSHRMIRYAATMGLAQEAVEAIFQAYFVEFRNIGSIEELVRIGESLGLETACLQGHLNSQVDVTPVFGENATAQRIGITGVPCFVFDEQSAIAGAQDTDIFLRLIDLSLEIGSQDSLVSQSQQTALR